MRIQNCEIFESSVERCDNCDAQVMDKAEAFQHDKADCQGEVTESSGWFYWSCSPGCLPDGDAIGPFSTSDEAAEDALEYGYYEDETLFTHVVDKDERGEYAAHVESWDGSVVFEYDNTEHDDDGKEYTGELSIVRDGFMRNANDLQGLTSYLIDLGILSKGDRIELERDSQ